MLVRRAESRDAADIAAIYNHYVENSTATFDTVSKTAEDREQWLQSHDDAYPVFVAEDGGSVIGFASVSPYRDRPAWAPTVEAGVYVMQGLTGSGVGPKLLSAIIEAARGAGHHVMVSQIVADNRASLVMCERAGFERVGCMREVGFKAGRWLDVEIVQLSL